MAPRFCFCALLLLGAIRQGATLQLASSCRVRAATTTEAATRAGAPRLIVTESCARSVTIGLPAEACFDAYSQLERIPEWNPILGRVKVISPTRSEWSARLPPALARIVPNCEWTSQQCLDSSECTISWQSVSGIDTSGEAIFVADGPAACVFTLTISYSLPGWLTPVATSPLARTFVNSSVNTTVG
jgi:uncharacterized membrane protein